MKALLIVCMLFFISCGDKDFFRTATSSGASSTPTPSGDISPDPLSPKMPVCEQFSGNFKDKIKPEDIMTQMNYDSSKLDDYICDNDKFVVCHVPPGNYEAAHFIEIGDSEKAIETHLLKYNLDDAGELHTSYLIKCGAFDALGAELEIENACGVICQP